MVRFLSALDPLSASLAALLLWRRGSANLRTTTGTRRADTLAAGPRRSGPPRAVGFEHRGLPGPRGSMRPDEDTLVLAPTPDEPVRWWRRILRGVLLVILVVGAAAALAAALWALGTFLTGEAVRYFETP